jgi:hypothetical protein
MRHNRWVRRVGLGVLAAVGLALPGGGMLGAMEGSGSGLVGGALGQTVGWRDDVDFDGLAIDEPTPDDVVEAGFAPDPGFFSDDEISGNLEASGIPDEALDAYVGAEDEAAAADPSCGIRWSLVAAIGRVESDHGRFGGSVLRPDGYGTKPIRGLPLDGRDGLALVRDTDRGALDGDTVYDRAVGPMQIIPSTWRNVGVDGNGDSRRDPNNVFDAAWGASVFLCAGAADLTEPRQAAAAVRRYNHTDEYVRVVLSLAASYEAGEFDPSPDDDPDYGSGAGDAYDFDDLNFDDGYDPQGDAIFDREFGVAAEGPDPAPVPGPGRGQVPPPAPAPAPAPPPTTPPTTAPAPAPSPPTTAPAPAPTPPATEPGPPPTVDPGRDAPPTTEAPDPTPSTTTPGAGEGDTGGDTGSTPPASVGWSPTMLEFVTDTVAARAAACPPAADAGAAVTPTTTAAPACPPASGEAAGGRPPGG